MQDRNATEFLQGLEETVTKERHLSPGETLEVPGSRPDKCFIVFEGRLEERHTSESGRYTVSRTFQRGHVILPPALQGERLDQVSRVAVSACEVGETKASVFWDHLLARPVLTHLFLTLCLEDLNETISRLVDANLVPVRERVRRELLRRAGDASPGTRPQIHIRSHDDFAAYLGANRETVSREIAWFSRRGAIETYRGHIVLNNLELLKEL